jgi:hypothetical protein
VEIVVDHVFVATVKRNHCPTVAHGRHNLGYLAGIKGDLLGLFFEHNEL